MTLQAIDLTGEKNCHIGLAEGVGIREEVIKSCSSLRQFWTVRRVALRDANRR